MQVWTRKLFLCNVKSNVFLQCYFGVIGIMIARCNNTCLCLQTRVGSGPPRGGVSTSSLSEGSGYYTGGPGPHEGSGTSAGVRTPRDRSGTVVG